MKAPNAAAAIRKDKTTAVHDVWVEEGYKEKNLADAIGFTVDNPVDEDEE